MTGQVGPWFCFSDLYIPSNASGSGVLDGVRGQMQSQEEYPGAHVLLADLRARGDMRKHCGSISGCASLVF